MTLRSDKVIFWYFMCLLGVAMPFWILGSVTHISGLPFNMQLSALLVLALPVISLAFIRYLHGKSAVLATIRACLPVRTNLRTMSVAILTLPLSMITVFVFVRLRVPFDGWAVSLYTVPLYFVLYYISAAFEEIGWTWLATPILGRRFGVAGAGLVIGLIWSLVHAWPWFQVNGVWFTVGMMTVSVASRIIMTWLFISNGQLLWLNIVYHAMINTVFTLFHSGSPYADPILYGLVLMAVATILIVGSRQIASTPKPMTPK